MAELDMRPSVTPNHKRNGASRHSVSFGKGFVRNPACRIFSANLQNNRFGQFCQSGTFSAHCSAIPNHPSMRFFWVQSGPVASPSASRIRVKASAIPVTNGLPALLNHISRVVGWCAEKQMAWVDTQFVVASVTNVHPSRNCPAGELPSQSMCKNPPALHRRLPVATAELAGSPQPTVSRLINLRPKKFGCHKHHSILLSEKGESLDG